MQLQKILSKHSASPTFSSQKYFGSSINFGWFSTCMPEYLQNGFKFTMESFASDLYPFRLTSRQVSTKSFKWLSRYWAKIIQKWMRIDRFLGKITPWKRQEGKNLMRRRGKGIYRRFWISNQIFDSIYGSRDMALSLDTTFGIFGQNRNFVDEYLENG